VGVRSSATGTEPSLPAIIFGGLHADIPLSASQGEQLADLIADDRLTCVLDVSEMSKREVSRCPCSAVRGRPRQVLFTPQAGSPDSSTQCRPRRRAVER